MEWFDINKKAWYQTLQLTKPSILTKLTKNAAVDKTIDPDKEQNTAANKERNTAADEAVNADKDQTIRGTKLRG